MGLVNSEGRDLGNSVSALFVRLPVGLDDIVDVLTAVSAEVGEDKRRHQALAAASFLRFLEPIPQDLLAKGTGIMHYQPFFNLIVTNVPGPPVPLYALGARLVEAFPILPLVGNQSLAVAAALVRRSVQPRCAQRPGDVPRCSGLLCWGAERVTNPWSSDARVLESDSSSIRGRNCSERFPGRIAAVTERVTHSPWMSRLLNANPPTSAHAIPTRS